MALTERSRSALFRGLSDVLDDEEAVGEMLSYFPARDMDEPASRDFVDARLTAVDARLTAVVARIDALESRMTSGFESVDARMKVGFELVAAHMEAGFATQRQAAEAALHAEIRSLTRWAVGTIVALFGLLIALGVIR